VVSINRFNHDTPKSWIFSVENREARAKVCSPRTGATAAKGAAELARTSSTCASRKSNFQFVYDEKDTLWDKINKIAKKNYRAERGHGGREVRGQIKKLQEDGYGHYPGASRRPSTRSRSRPATARGAGRTTW